jgi:hypothetical protein
VRKITTKLEVAITGAPIKFLGDVEIPDWRHREAEIKTRGMIYEMQVDKLVGVSKEYRGAQIAEIKFVTRKQLAALIDDEEQAIIPLIK